MKPVRTAIGLAAAAILSNIIIVGAPAAAGPTGSPITPITPLSATNRYVDGSGIEYDDLANEANLCQGCAVSRGNYVGMWQLILAADDLLPRGDVDCLFGPQTEAATRAWQAAEGLAVTGTVNSATRATADNYLFISGDRVVYRGTESIINFRRRGAGHQYPYLYEVLIGSTGQWYPLHYDISSIPGC